MKGFTLIETMVALGVTGSLILAGLELSRLVHQHNSELKARHLQQSLVDEIQLLLSQERQCACNLQFERPELGRGSEFPLPFLGVHHEDKERDCQGAYRDKPISIFVSTSTSHKPRHRARRIYVSDLLDLGTGEFSAHLFLDLPEARFPIRVPFYFTPIFEDDSQNFLKGAKGCHMGGDGLIVPPDSLVVTPGLNSHQKAATVDLPVDFSLAFNQPIRATSLTEKAIRFGPPTDLIAPKEVNSVMDLIFAAEELFLKGSDLSFQIINLGNSRNFIIRVEQIKRSGILQMSVDPTPLRTPAGLPYNGDPRSLPKPQVIYFNARDLKSVGCQWRKVQGPLFDSNSLWQVGESEFLPNFWSIRWKSQLVHGGVQYQPLFFNSVPQEDTRPPNDSGSNKIQDPLQINPLQDPILFGLYHSNDSKVPESDLGKKRYVMGDLKKISVSKLGHISREHAVEIQECKAN